MIMIKKNGKRQDEGFFNKKKHSLEIISYYKMANNK
jgi:hypothetical protein